MSSSNGNFSSKSNVSPKEPIAPKSPPDTPPRTPSPSVSVERPLTPQTPGLSPATTPTIVVNIHNDRSSLVSPACSTSSKASSVDSHCSKRLKSGRSKHKTLNAIAGLTASYGLSMAQTGQTYGHNSQAINWDIVYNDAIQSHLKSHLLNSAKSSPQIPFMSYQMPVGAQREPKPQNYPNVTNVVNNHNHHIPPLINSYPHFDSNQKHSGYDYQCFSANESTGVEAKKMQSSETVAASGHSYRTQLNGHLVGQQQRLLRPSRLDAVLVKKDHFVSPQISPQYETGIYNKQLNGLIDI